ncbi:MAG: hypothetical protein U0264_10430 [Candidatus Kapaibacterium sp.]
MNNLKILSFNILLGCVLLLTWIGCCTCPKSQFGEDRRVVLGGIKIVNRYVSDSVVYGKGRLRVRVYDKYDGKAANSFWVHISSDAINGIMRKFHESSSTFELDIPYGRYDVYTWLGLGRGETLPNIIIKSNEIIEISAEIGGVWID